VRPLIAALAALALLILPATARALTCPNIPLPDRLAQADAAFVGRLTAARPEPGKGTLYRFDVRQRVKGPVGGLVEIRAVSPLTDSRDQPLVTDTVVGVLAGLDGAALTTSSCLLTDPAALLEVADEPRGGAIKVVIGLAILGSVIAWAVVRRRRGTRPELPGAPTPEAE
jgi:hypothetical protein